jgi:CRISPR-associated endonuclease/helicase Cas3
MIGRFVMRAPSIDFDAVFEELTGHAPFPWQKELYKRFVTGSLPTACDLPTGLGKTSVIPIWLIALATAPNVIPRRLVYVVNRRTVVDQASDEALSMRKKLESLGELTSKLAALCSAKCDPPLAISILRGQFADNGEWSADPARPAIVVGTVDMIGSRLLFSGYGRGFKSRPLHAGFLGQDVLLVHDEAHLEPAFQRVLVEIAGEQARSREFRTFRVMELSATSRGGEEPFKLTTEDRVHPIVQKRIAAKKTVSLHPVDDEKKTADEIARIALGHADSAQAILVFVRRLDDLEKVADKLKKQAVQRLTGTLRGRERDRLAREDDIFARFLPKPLVTPRPGTVYLLCTSAGEVGVNISADHLVCDLTPFESMAQRFGRVNRFGEGDARVDVVHPTTFDEQKGLDASRQKTLALLRQLNGNVSPLALSKLDPKARLQAFTPPPPMRTTSGILFDAWALTSIRDELPGRPPVAEFLHGVADWQPPQTQVAWRWDVELISGELLADYKREDWLDDYPLKPHELLRDSSERVFKELEKLAADRKAAWHATEQERERISKENETRKRRPVWLIDDDDQIEPSSLAEIVEAGKRLIERKLILLSPFAGGFAGGTLNGNADYDSKLRYDVADEWFDAPSSPEDQRSEEERRLRVRADSAEPLQRAIDGMRLIRKLVLREANNEFSSPDAEPATERLWSWYVRPRAADDAGSEFARFDQPLGMHLQAAEQYAKDIAERLRLPEAESFAVRLAAKWHDVGKDRTVWQKSVGNIGYPTTAALAKSSKPMRWRDLNSSRHEFGSLLDMLDPSQPFLREFEAQSQDVRELVLHLIAAHHGRARPHFAVEEITDARHQSITAERCALEVPRRFTRLQRKYGRWGLAWLESLVRAADVLASLERDGE